MKQVAYKWVNYNSYVSCAYLHIQAHLYMHIKKCDLQKCRIENKKNKNNKRLNDERYK